jgi:hypothetical protein
MVVALVVVLVVLVVLVLVLVLSRGKVLLLQRNEAFSAWLVAVTPAGPLEVRQALTAWMPHARIMILHLKLT